MQHLSSYLFLCYVLFGIIAWKVGLKMEISEMYRQYLVNKIAEYLYCFLSTTSWNSPDIWIKIFRDIHIHEILMYAFSDAWKILDTVNIWLGHSIVTMLVLKQSKKMNFSISGVNSHFNLEKITYHRDKIRFIFCRTNL